MNSSEPLLISVREGRVDDTRRDTRVVVFGGTWRTTPRRKNTESLTSWCVLLDEIPLNPPQEPQTPLDLSMVEPANRTNRTSSTDTCSRLTLPSLGCNRVFVYFTCSVGICHLPLFLWTRERYKSCPITRDRNVRGGGPRPDPTSNPSTKIHFPSFCRALFTWRGRRDRSRTVSLPSRNKNKPAVSLRSR